ncbi:uncharacterized protein EURHEDRAFT_182185 [Aspergillus ruber CBS 135680]|uniref:Uncharacterized protein n=1 Tax=Aspergillus ruber (strain CBS 135680) TaxID=1388766 RepID=A0A017S608_ASPRC|nr:uncharacterized protein EURHEDRAFT_182185 [Aspergillus ruber CBS 135680]EYE92473.1 hypothetical protein EURHEDRAFT_182185 [Aspergillus ruber CBS 135680]
MRTRRISNNGRNLLFLQSSRTPLSRRYQTSSSSSISRMEYGWCASGVSGLQCRQARKVTNRKSMRKNAEILENGGGGRKRAVRACKMMLLLMPVPVVLPYTE